jgi:hypothetical protein
MFLQVRYDRRVVLLKDLKSPQYCVGIIVNPVR